MALFESPSGTTFKKDLEIQGLFFRLVESALLSFTVCIS
ncbi:hypothetical protein ALQ20_03843 [Pseudomonas syringae pv. atrofaciens]|nr:hypothetical protein ALQ20_03843 [Pseudomonas syringae pv. atrofaciens]